MDNMKLLLICTIITIFFFINVYVVLFLFNNVIYCMTVCLCMTTLTEVFPCVFLSCKANARVMPAKTGHGPRSS
jgi:magnesium-transporting ATPase (P-type)